MMARIFVEHMHIKYTPKSNSSNQKSKSGNRKYVTNAMRDPEQILAGQDIHSILRPEYVNSELAGALGVNSVNEEARYVTFIPFLANSDSNIRCRMLNIQNME